MGMEMLSIAFTAILSVISRSRTGSAFRIIEAGRNALRRAGFEPAPMGVRNEKTGLPSMYRPVGATCPVECKLHPMHHPVNKAPCYATTGNVRCVQKRATDVAMSSAVSAMLVMAARQAEIAKARREAVTRREFLAQVGNPRTGARLHVSGDFMADGEIDVDYIGLLCEAADRVRNHFETEGCVAYTYTHIPRARFEAWRLILRQHGIEVMYSRDDHDPDSLSPTGGEAVIWRHEELDALQARLPSWLRAVPCPAQVRDEWTCSRCLLCSVSKEGVVVAFAPHGVQASKL